MYVHGSILRDTSGHPEGKCKGGPGSSLKPEPSTTVIEEKALEYEAKRTNMQLRK